MSEGTEEIVNYDVPKSERSLLRSASDGESDEFVMLHQSKNIIIHVITPYCLITWKDDGIPKQHSGQLIIITNLAFRFPFIIGFGEDLIEIRLAVNGNLLASMYMPSVKLLSSKANELESVARERDNMRGGHTPNVRNLRRSDILNIHRNIDRLLFINKYGMLLNHLLKSVHLRVERQCESGYNTPDARYDGKVSDAFEIGEYKL
uniref:PITH domain-containing protein n=1 Tax=Heterorhabditis bacteriophora TaxID=37862 RepID=A0A1I7X349_HETBA